MYFHIFHFKLFVHVHVCAEYLFLAYEWIGPSHETQTHRVHK